MPHLVLGAQDLEAGCLFLEIERRDRAAAVSQLTPFPEDEIEIGDIAIADKGLAARDDDVVALGRKARRHMCRVGAGIGAELGGMRVTEQIDALESLAVDSFHYLAVTRVVACMIAMPILTTVMNFSGLIGGYLAETVISGVSLRVYLGQAFQGIAFADYILPTVKTTVFGFIIGTVSSYLGYTATGGSEGVGRASTRSVVVSSMLLIVVNVVLVRIIQMWLRGQSL